MNLFGVDLTNPEAITGIVLLITTIIGSVSTAVSQVQKKLKDQTVKLIGRAEEKYADEDYAGNKKHDYVVDKLNGEVPVILRPFFSKEDLGELVSGTFDNINHFSEIRLASQPEQSEDAAIALADTPPVLFESSSEGGIPISRIPLSPPEGLDISATNRKGREESYGTKTDSAPQQMPGDSVVQDRCVQSTVRVFTLRSRHGVVCRSEYRVCKRERDGGGGRPR